MLISIHEEVFFYCHEIYLYSCVSLKTLSKHDTLCMREYPYSQQEPSYYRGLSLVPAPVRNYTHYKMWDGITYQFIKLDCM